MSIKNPRRYSIPHAVAIGTLTLVSFFVSLCFDFGNGSFGGGVKSTLGYLLFPFGFGLLIVSALVAWLALLTGRWIGTTLSAFIACCLLGASVIHSSATSQPLARFRHYIWSDAPDSLLLLEHEAYRSFNDGTAYLFSLSTTPDMIEQLCASAGLVRVRPNPDELRFGPLPTEIRRLRGIGKRSFPADTEFYAFKNIELAYMPADQEALVVCFPRRD